MAIELNNLRVYALGLAHRAVSDISRDGFRQLRNYVDMCAFLAKTEDQQRFFDRAQTALEKTDSLYYPLIQRTLSTVSADSICTVGVNLGIDALTYGGSQLKKHAQETGKPVYWMTVADSAEGDALQPRITQGEDAGQFLWILLSRDGSVDAAQCLAGTHPKSDFGLVLPAQAITPQITAALLDMPLPGFTQAMLAASLAKTPHAVISRAAAGTLGQSIIINLPGSRKAVVENLAAVLPALPHALAKLQGDPADCGG